jgi:hypothetical protein
MAVSPHRAELDARLDMLKRTNGWGQKTGAERQAEAEIQRLKGPQETGTLPGELTIPANADKPVVRVERTFSE